MTAWRPSSHSGGLPSVNKIDDLFGIVEKFGAGNVPSPIKDGKVCASLAKSMLYLSDAGIFDGRCKKNNHGETPEGMEYLHDETLWFFRSSNSSVRRNRLNRISSLECPHVVALHGFGRNAVIILILRSCAQLDNSSYSSQLRFCPVLPPVVINAILCWNETYEGKRLLKGWH